ncbi:MAG TPA: malonyl-ACP O-methyltransferase BioC [Azospira sp.]|nr:malonyl-ACP O-methyltransferase BioC [Azospira sp.]
MDQDTPSFVDRRQVRRAFSRAASGYDEEAFVAREVMGRMAERLDYVKLEPGRIVDLGCGTGTAQALLKQRFPQAQYLGLDNSLPMLSAAQSKLGLASGRLRLPSWLGGSSRTQPQLVAADATALPLPQGSCGLLWSNLLLHWLDDPLPALKEIHRVLEVGGLLMFATLGPDTLKELRAAFGDGYAHTQRFIDMHDWGDMLVGCGFADPVMDMEMLTLTYPDFDALVRELKATGDTCAMHGRRPGLTGKGVWQEARRAFDAKRQEGRAPVTLEIVYGHAWKSQPKTTADGRSVIRFDLPRRGV